MLGSVSRGESALARWGGGWGNHSTYRTIKIRVAYGVELVTEWSRKRKRNKTMVHRAPKRNLWEAYDYVYAYLSLCMSSRTYIYRYVYMHIHIYIYVCIDTYQYITSNYIVSHIFFSYICIHTHIYIYTYVCMCVCVWGWSLKCKSQVHIQRTYESPEMKTPPRTYKITQYQTVMWFKRVPETNIKG